MPQDFTAAAHQLAAALIQAFPDLTFSADPNTHELDITAGSLQLHVAPAAPAPEAAPLDETITRAGAFKGEQQAGFANGEAGRQGHRVTAHRDELAKANAGLDFDALPVGQLTPEQFLGLSKARVRAQNGVLAFPGDAERKALYAQLTARWSAEIKAQRAEASAPTQLGGYQAPVGPKGYEGD